MPGSTNVLSVELMCRSMIAMSCLNEKMTYAEILHTTRGAFDTAGHGGMEQALKRTELPAVVEPDSSKSSSEWDRIGNRGGIAVWSNGDACIMAIFVEKSSATEYMCGWWMSNKAFGAGAVLDNREDIQHGVFYYNTREEYLQAKEMYYERPGDFAALIILS